MKILFQKIQDFFVDIYSKLIKMDDSPQRIAMGFGIGVFLGILPGTGPLAALAAAFIFRINKAAVFLGCILTNSWLSIASFVLAIKIGSAALGLKWEDITQQAHDLFTHFTWQALFGQSMGNIIKPLLIGYAVVGSVCGLIAYAVAILVLKRSRTPPR